MKAFSRMVLRKRMEQVIGLAAVLVLLASAVSIGVAAGLPIAAGGQPASPQSYTVADCEALLARFGPYLRQESTANSGLIAWRHDTQGFRLCHPAGWSLSAPDPATIVLTPTKRDWGARFYVQVMDTPGAMTADDLQWRIHWFDAIISTPADADVSWQARWHSGNVYGFEAEYTYSGDDITLSRWVRLLYVDTRQYWLVAEAPATMVSGGLRPLFQAMMLTFRPDDQTDEGS